MPTSPEDELLALTDSMCSASEQGDAETLDRLLADDVILVTRTGGTWDKATTMAHWGAPADPGVTGSHEISDARVHLFGDVGIVSAVIVDRIVANGDERVIRERVFDVWRHRDGAWQMIASQSIDLADD